jgi:hypothetical protein
LSYQSRLFVEQFLGRGTGKGAGRRTGKGTGKGTEVSLAMWRFSVILLYS